MTTIALRSEFKKEKVTSDFFVRSHFVNNLKADVLNHICSLNLSETSGSGSRLFHGCTGLSDIGVGVECI